LNDDQGAALPVALLAPGLALAADTSANLSVQVVPAAPLGTESVINPSNPASAASITDGSGNVWSFGAAINAAFGGYHVLRNGAAQDTPSANGTWQLKKAVDGTMWAMDMAGFQWYHWHDSAWVATGTAPPVDGTNGMPAALENTSNSLSDTPTMHTWLGRIPDSIAGLPSGPLDYFGFDGFFPPNGTD
jgi:hypothetical protein